MCYVKCVIEGLKVLKHGGDVDKARTIEVYSLNNDELVDDCSKEMSEFFSNFSVASRLKNFQARQRTTTTASGLTYLCGA